MAVAWSFKNSGRRLGSLSRGVARNTKKFILPALRAPRVVRPASSSSPQILMLVFSDLRIDPRVLREARALADAGFRVRFSTPT